MNVGEYVRTKDGKIFKWTKYCTTSKEDYSEHTRKLLFDENEIKSSPQIIDLIEKGDYINGSWVNEIKDGKPYHEDYNDPYYSYYIENNDIKTIVTHEQMEAMQYKVEE